jgi:phosphoribosyl 1,2-cyclic phosphate phosphodiesterase
VCRSTDPRDRRLRPSALLEWDDASVLIDTSADFREQALRARILRVDAVLYTHAHADHILGLDDLRIFNWRQGGAVPVYGSPETLAGIARTFWYAFADVPLGGTKPTVDLRPVAGPFALGGRSIVPVPVFHGVQEILGYRIGRFAYLTDVSRIPEASLALLRGLDVLVLSALRPRPHPTHLHLAAAIDLARSIGAGRTYFTHLGHEMPHRGVSATLPPGIELAWDGLSFEVASSPEGMD